jgi:hypothetical protein
MYHSGPTALDHLVDVDELEAATAASPKRARLLWTLANNYYPRPRRHWSLSLATKSATS